MTYWDGQNNVGNVCDLVTPAKKSECYFGHGFDALEVQQEAIDLGYKYFTWGSHAEYFKVYDDPYSSVGTPCEELVEDGPTDRPEKKKKKKKEEAQMKKLVMFFDEKCELQDPDIVGNKAANLIKMKRQGIPVPEGFVLPTTNTFDTCIWQSGDFGPGFEFDSDLMIRARAAVRFAADRADKDWSATTTNPYLVSVRSGSAVSMPGMMDTILNLGLNDFTVEQLGIATNERFALDCYRRLIEMFGTTVEGIDKKKFKKILDAAGEWYDTTTSTAALYTLLNAYKLTFAEEAGYEFPQSPDEQLVRAINAVYKSWFSERAIAYREKAGISGELGTAVTVQGMRFGNMNLNSATGVVFSRNPDTGDHEPYGEFLVNAQGEDVVAGTHNARPIAELGTVPGLSTAAFDLANHMANLDTEYGGIVDIEFTIEDGKLWILQVRKGKVTTQAKLRFLLDELIEEVQSSTASDAKALPPHYIGAINELFATAAPAPAATTSTPAGKLAGEGQGVSQGIVTAHAVFTTKDVEDAKAEGEPYIWIADETTPDDTPQMLDAAGILTTTGSSVSHAAVCAREWGLPCVVGFEDMDLSANPEGVISAVINNEWQLNAGDLITINGTTGEVMLHD